MNCACKRTCKTTRSTLTFYEFDEIKSRYQFIVCFTYNTVSYTQSLNFYFEMLKVFTSMYFSLYTFGTTCKVTRYAEIDIIHIKLEDFPIYSIIHVHAQILNLLSI